MKIKPNQSLGQLADAAMKQAARKAVERALQTGTPVILWRNGAVVAVPPEELLKPRKRKKKA